MSTPASSIDSLLQAAKSASPSVLSQVRVRQKDRWAKLWPVYSELRGRRFKIRDAIEWLISHKAMEEKDMQKATFAFKSMATRQNKRTAQAGLTAESPQGDGDGKGGVR